MSFIFSDHSEKALNLRERLARWSVGLELTKTSKFAKIILILHEELKVKDLACRVIFLRENRSVKIRTNNSDCRK